MVFPKQKWHGPTVDLECNTFNFGDDIRCRCLFWSSLRAALPVFTMQVAPFDLRQIGDIRVCE